MSAPVLLPTQAIAETFGGVTYHVDGELVPVLTVDVTLMPVYFDYDLLLLAVPAVLAAREHVGGQTIDRPLLFGWVALFVVQPGDRALRLGPGRALGGAVRVHRRALRCGDAAMGQPPLADRRRCHRR